MKITFFRQKFGISHLKKNVYKTLSSIPQLPHVGVSQTTGRFHGVLQPLAKLTASDKTLRIMISASAVITYILFSVPWPVFSTI